MTNIITILQVISAIVLIVLVLSQNRGGGLSGMLGGGGGGDGGNVYRTKRGMEKIIFIATIIFSTIFLGLSLVNILIQA